MKNGTDMIFRGIVIAILVCGINADGFARNPVQDKNDTAAGGELDDRTSVPAEYQKYPRATFRLLLEDYDFLKGEKFRGALYPGKVVDIPQPLMEFAAKDSKLLFAVTGSRSLSLYVIIPAGILKSVTEMIQSGRKLYFVYTPCTVYGGLPVVKLLESTAESQATKETLNLEIARYYPVGQGSKWSVLVQNVRILEYEISESSRDSARGIKRETVPNKPGMEKTINFSIYYTQQNITIVEEGRDMQGNAYKKTDLALQAPVVLGTKWDATTGNETRKREIVGLNDKVQIGSKEYKDVVIVQEEAVMAPDDTSGFFAVAYYFYNKDTGFIGCKIDSSNTRQGLRKYNQIDEWFMQRKE